MSARRFKSAPPDEMSVREAAEVLGVHENTVRNMCADGRLSYRQLPFSGYHRPLRASVAQLAEEIHDDVQQA